MAISKAKKEQVLADLKVRVGAAKSMVFVKNIGLSVEEMMEIRGKLRENGSGFKIAKKTLIAIALKEHNFPEVDKAILDGPIGVAFGEDEVSSAKILADFAKIHKEHIELMGGMLDGKVLSQADVIALSKIPSREELLAKLVGSMKSPISGFHGVLSGTIRGFVQVLGQVKDQKAQAA